MGQQYKANNYTFNKYLQVPGKTSLQQMEYLYIPEIEKNRHISTQQTHQSRGRINKHIYSMAHFE